MTLIPCFLHALIIFLSLFLVATKIGSIPCQTTSDCPSNMCDGSPRVPWCVGYYCECMGVIGLNRFSI
ncbi:hypothetical protein P8452_53303 [Trifolium repens]|nr:hypothetical protein P8452_53303 [Trifolium repens]